MPPIPVKMAPAERRAVIATAALFVETAVRREHAERAYELVGPNLRGDTTRDEWRDGDIPVVPYPVDDARWKFDYSYANEIGLQVAVFPQPGRDGPPGRLQPLAPLRRGGCEAPLADRLLVAAGRWRRRIASEPIRGLALPGRPRSAERVDEPGSGVAARARRAGRARAARPRGAACDRARPLAPRAEGVRRVAGPLELELEPVVGEFDAWRRLSLEGPVREDHAERAGVGGSLLHLHGREVAARGPVVAAVLERRLARGAGRRRGPVPRSPRTGRCRPSRRGRGRP